MNPSKLYDQFLERFNHRLKVLADKPEESPESTLRALWLTAVGNPVSAQKAIQHDLPDLDDEALVKLNILIDRRIAGEPLGHLTGRQQFMGIEMITGPEALIPRKETELLGNAAVAFLRELSEQKGAVTVIDVCTGAGNLAISYAMNIPDASVYASDLSEDAVSLTRKNIEFHGLDQRVEARAGDLLDPFDTSEFHHSVDLLSCNPPYISSAKVEVMDEEIASHEPRLAFDGGPFGIKILQKLISEAPKYLRTDGCLMFEVGLGQGEMMVKRLDKTKQFCRIVPLLDDNGDTRAIEAYV